MALINLAERDGLIYVITDGCGHYKIGKSNSEGLNRRISDLQISNPFLLRLVHQRLCQLDLAFHAEKMIHQLLAAHRVRGEWFRGRPDMIIKAVDDCVDRVLSMDDALEDLMLIAEQQKELYRSRPSDKTELHDAMEDDIYGPRRLGATIRSTHGRPRPYARGKQRGGK